MIFYCRQVVRQSTSCSGSTGNGVGVYGPQRGKQRKHDCCDASPVAGHSTISRGAVSKVSGIRSTWIIFKINHATLCLYETTRLIKRWKLTCDLHSWWDCSKGVNGRKRERIECNGATEFTGCASGWRNIPMETKQRHVDHFRDLASNHRYYTDRHNWINLWLARKFDHSRTEATGPPDLFQFTE